MKNQFSIISLIIILLFFYSKDLLKAQYNWVITQDTIWNGTIIINENLTINSQSTLTILPGSIIKFDGNFSITVEGTLIANGTSGNEILFTSNHTAPTAYHGAE